MDWGAGKSSASVPCRWFDPQGLRAKSSTQSKSCVAPPKAEVTSSNLVGARQGFFTCIIWWVVKTMTTELLASQFTRRHRGRVSQGAGHI